MVWAHVVVSATEEALACDLSVELEFAVVECCASTEELGYGRPLSPSPPFLLSQGSTRSDEPQAAGSRQESGSGCVGLHCSARG